MLRTECRNAWGLLLVFGVALVPASAIAETEDPAVEASLRCDRALEPGRVRCSVVARAPMGREIAWADVVILSVPEFATALKARIGPGDIVAQDATTFRWELALVVRRKGEGEVTARVRVVLCDLPEADAGESSLRMRCAPATVTVRGALSVG